MSDPISSLRNLGPAIERDFAKAGIVTAQHLRELGADDAYRALLKSGKSPHFISYYVLVMALQGRPWNDCQGAEKAALRQKFDAIKAETAQPSRGAGSTDIDHILNEIGVIEKGPGS